MFIQLVSIGVSAFSARIFSTQRSVRLNKRRNRDDRVVPQHTKQLATSILSTWEKPKLRDTIQCLDIRLVAREPFIPVHHLCLRCLRGGFDMRLFGSIFSIFHSIYQLITQTEKYTCTHSHVEKEKTKLNRNEVLYLSKSEGIDSKGNRCVQRRYLPLVIYFLILVRKAIRMACE